MAHSSAVGANTFPRRGTPLVQMLGRNIQLASGQKKSTRLHPTQKTLPIRPHSGQKISIRSLPVKQIFPKVNFGTAARGHPAAKKRASAASGRQKLSVPTTSHFCVNTLQVTAATPRSLLMHGAPKRKTFRPPPPSYFLGFWRVFFSMFRGFPNRPRRKNLARLFFGVPEKKMFALF